MSKLSPYSHCNSARQRPIGNHTFRARGITAYLKNGGTLEKAAAIATQASTQTTRLYDPRRDDVSLKQAIVYFGANAGPGVGRPAYLAEVLAAARSWPLPAEGLEALERLAGQ